MKAKLRKRLIGAIFVSVAVFLTPVYYYWNNGEDSGNSAEIIRDRIAQAYPSVRIGETEIKVEVAKSAAEIQKGLSGRPLLEQNKGMLFVFSNPYRYRFWMPDMRFPIDILWIRDGKIIDMDENVPNKFDPANPMLYRPSSPAQYVLEINAGFAKNKKIFVGDPVIFSGVE